MVRRVGLGLLLFAGTAELAARGTGLGPVVVPDVTSSFEPTPWVRPDAQLGIVLVPGTFQGTLRDPAGQAAPRRWSVTHDADGQRVVPGGGGGRVVHLHGGSFVYGFGVDDGDALGARLATAHPDWQVQVLAVPGFGLTQMWLRYQATLAATPRPDVVVVGYAAFHDERTAGLGHWTRSLAPQAVALGLHAGRLPFTRSVAGVPDVQWRPLAGAHLPGATDVALVAGVERLLDGVEQARVQPHAVARHLLRHWHDHAAAQGIGLLVMGVSTDVHTRATLAALAADGVWTLDPGVDLEAPGARLLPHDAHPAAGVHAQWATALSHALARTGATHGP